MTYRDIRTSDKSGCGHVSPWAVAPSHSVAVYYNILSSDVGTECFKTDDAIQKTIFHPEVIKFQ